VGSLTIAQANSTDLSGSPKDRTWRSSSISRAWATSPRLPLMNRITGSGPDRSQSTKWFGRRSNPYLLGFNQALYRLSYQTLLPIWVLCSDQAIKKPGCQRHRAKKNLIKPGIIDAGSARNRNCPVHWQNDIPRSEFLFGARAKRFVSTTTFDEFLQLRKKAPDCQLPLTVV
jgi:hypothetical protein